MNNMWCAYIQAQKHQNPRIAFEIHYMFKRILKTDATSRKERCDMRCRITTAYRRPITRHVLIVMAANGASSSAI